MRILGRMPLGKALHAEADARILLVLGGERPETWFPRWSGPSQTGTSQNGPAYDGPAGQVAPDGG
ncbi:hypothetical protein GCM10022226_62140 [Sphaerisporangium flaviroseum]|uniref:Uncharacterized protein n=1 Tax=Sphaerisporangium flaviroseum TaxID=509199 RepID=A0ABP7J303_9ACTN